MPPSRIKKNIPKPVRKEREGMSEAHLDKVRDCPCAVTGREPAQAHHLLRTEERGLSRKSSDRWAIPLHADAHRALHDAGDEEAYLMGYGIDGRALASALWAVRGKSAEHYRMVIFAHRQRAALKVRAAL